MLESFIYFVCTCAGHSGSHPRTAGDPFEKAIVVQQAGQWELVLSVHIYVSEAK